MNLTEALHNRFLVSPVICTDSRNVEPNSIFFALSGENFDGNEFAHKALDNGAAIAVISNPEKEIPGKTVLVDDTLKCLQDLASFHRKALNTPILALTGSNGKTTTKELLYQVLKTKFNVLATQGNLNNHIGVPLTLLRLTEAHNFAIVEMGANHQREIAALCEIVQPNFGLITNYGKAHLEGFGGIEGVIKGKSEMFDFLRQIKGFAFVNADDPIQMEKANGILAKTFSFKNKKADYLFDSGLSEKGAFIGFEGEKIQSNLMGDFFKTNLALATAVGLHFDIPIGGIATAIAAYTSKNNRAEIARTPNNKLLLDAYNANPDSVSASLHSFAKMTSQQPKWAVLGDMFELGDSEAEEHQKIVDMAQGLNFEKLILAGKAFGHCRKANRTMHFDTTQQLGDFLQQNPPKGKFILLKGSRGMKLESLLEVL